MSSVNFIRHCLLGVSISLLGVGLVSNTFVRHIIQIAPMILTVMIIKDNDYWMAAAGGFLIFWLLIMVLIWLFLLDVSRIITGHYTSTEIILTIVMAFFAGLGLFRLMKRKVNTKKIIIAVFFIAGFLAQYGVLIWSYSLPL